MTESSDTTEERATLKRAALLPYALGLALCVAWPLALEIFLTRLPIAPPSSSQVVESTGHTFTGLVFLAAAYIFWRRRRARGKLSDQSPRARCQSLKRELLVATLIFGACSLLGPLYFVLAGRPGLRHARSFIATVPIMFLAFSPRLSSWASGSPGHRREHA
nr:hypothetical protein [uncultured Holophaga sp.]